MSIAASGDGFTSSEDEGAVGLPPSGVVATAAPDPWASGWRSTDRPVLSPRGWTIGFSERGAAHNRALPRCLSSRRCIRSWRSRGWPLFTARSRSSASSILTTLDGGVARGYAGIPQVERAIAVHLCPRNAATWRNRPRLPSKACKLTAALAAKAYSAAARQPPPCTPWLSCRFTKPRRSNRYTRVRQGKFIYIAHFIHSGNSKCFT